MASAVSTRLPLRYRTSGSFNFTGRKRIPRENVSIVLNRAGDTIKSFHASVDIEKLGLPENAKVLVEAYHMSDYKRFDFGTVGKITHPDNTELDIAHAESLRFRILVIDEKGRILASADKLRPEGVKKTILDVDFQDLGKQVWRVEYKSDVELPVLILNNKIPNVANLVKSDPQFFFHIFPAVLREILTHMIWVDGTNEEEPEIDWHKDWLKFTRRFAEPPCLDRNDPDFDEGEVEEWIETCVREFCERHAHKWDEFIRLIQKQAE